MCGYLPLALRIAGARLVSRPTWKISWFATRLADESRRLDLLKAGELEVRASFGLSYRGRPETEQRAFRLLGLLPADFPAWNLAAAEPPGMREESLARLADQYIGAARLAAPLVHPGATDPEPQPQGRCWLRRWSAVTRGPGSWPNGPASCGWSSGPAPPGYGRGPGWPGPVRADPAAGPRAGPRVRIRWPALLAVAAVPTR
jgi:hypothetical protein